MHLMLWQNSRYLYPENKKLLKVIIAPSQMKKCPYNGVASFEGNNLVLFYCFSASEIRPSKRVGGTL